MRAGDSVAKGIGRESDDELPRSPIVGCPGGRETTGRWRAARGGGGFPEG